MANNDQIIGFLMALIGAFGILTELYYLIIYPLIEEVPFEGRIYWAIALPLFLGVSGVLAIILWIGITMVQTPPPEAWDFDDLEDELEGDDEPAGDIEGIDGVTKTNSVVLREAGYNSRAKLAAANPADLEKLKGIGKATAVKIVESAK
ncbi:MAG: helix-hairpin-helix domain-containing protein [Candidatus Kariarchaeaceae archaeon]